jgi:SagB-type dehydrogenase family enzyme
MAPDNRPAPFKRYRKIERLPLPGDLRPPADAPSALEALARDAASATNGPVDLDILARLLYFSAGVTRYSSRGRARAWFRASASAGNLHPLELYVACGPDLDVPQGLYHFDPESFSLGRLRPTDVRPHLAHAADDAAVAAAAGVMVVTGIPWRTSWKYAERGWRHIFWDAGSLLANVLAVAAAYGLPARVVLGFVDRDVSHVLGIDGTSELPVAAVALGSGPVPAGLTASAGDLDPLHPEVDPLSPHPVEFPLVAEAQRASDLDNPEAVAGWHDACTAGLGRHTGAATVDPVDIPTLGETSEPIESLILRRGSTRLMERRPIPSGALDWALRVATRAVPMDAIPTGRTLLSHHLVIHAVDGHRPGLYRWADGTLAPSSNREAESTRDLSTFLCLGQPLGGDSAYTVFESTDLDAVLDELGPRGYRAAHLEAGFVNGRLLLAAHALGHGATGLTFFDDEVRAAFSIPTGCLLVTAVGVPAYRPTPGGWPGHPTRLHHYDTLMTRLEARLRGPAGPR